MRSFSVAALRSGGWFWVCWEGLDTSSRPLGSGLVSTEEQALEEALALAGPGAVRLKSRIARRRRVSIMGDRRRCRFLVGGVA